MIGWDRLIARQLFRIERAIQQMGRQLMADFTTLNANLDKLSADLTALGNTVQAEFDALKNATNDPTVQAAIDAASGRVAAMASAAEASLAAVNPPAPAPAPAPAA